MSSVVGRKEPESDGILERGEDKCSEFGVVRPPPSTTSDGTVKGTDEDANLVLLVDILEYRLNFDANKYCLEMACCLHCKLCRQTAGRAQSRSADRTPSDIQRR